MKVLTTHSNPGAFRTQSPPSLARIGKHTVRTLMSNGVRSTGWLLTAELTNALNYYVRGWRGGRLVCSCCKTSAPSFVHKAGAQGVSWHSMCPTCDSRSRHRGLALLFPRLQHARASLGRVLHFAPEPVLTSVLRRLPHDGYETADYLLTDVDHPKQDIQQLTLPSGFYDLVVCNHVLEHVPDDARAVSEVARILRQEGMAIFTIPGDFLRAHTVTFPKLTSNGHYRDYGLDAEALFRRAFTHVQLLDMSEYNKTIHPRSYAIRSKDIAFVCANFPLPASTVLIPAVQSVRG